MPWISVFNSTAVICLCLPFQNKQNSNGSINSKHTTSNKTIRSEAETGMQCTVIKLLIKLNALKEVVGLVQSLTISLIHILHFNSPSERSLAE